MDRGLDLGRNRARQHGTLSGWGAAALRCGPHLGVQPGSAALGGAGLAVRLAVLVAGLLSATGLTALASLATGAGRPSAAPATQA